MTGLAATLGADSPATAIAIADGLAARGPDLATWRAGSAHLLVRAAMPTVHEIPTGALLLDGNAAPSELAAAYASGGRRGLLTGRHPYAVVLADLSRDALLLARNGDGPPLYWARLGRTVLVASEPAALLAAGVPARPDEAVVERFLATGACDDTPATFFAGVRRVLPGQVVEMTRAVSGGGVRVQDPPAAPQITASAALAAADLSGRIGVRLGRGIGGAAVLAAALSRAEQSRSVPVYSAAFPELAGVDTGPYGAAALLGPPASRFGSQATSPSSSRSGSQVSQPSSRFGSQGPPPSSRSGSHASPPSLRPGSQASPNVLTSARHRALPFFADELDIDSYLVDLGEPTPELDDWLRWAIARRVAGEVDALVDAGAGTHLSRLADRVTSRFGVGLRVPLRDVPEAGRQAALAGIVQRSLPSTAAVIGEVEAGTDALLAGLLRRMRAELVTTFLRPRGTSGGLADALALIAGRPVDVRSLWRRYILERWLRTLPDALSGASVRHNRETPDQEQVDGHPEHRTWGGPRRLNLSPQDRRLSPVRTELLAAGDKLPEKLAWYVGEAVARLNPTTSWYVLLAAKPVAVMQGRARYLWDIQPGPTARLLHRLARRGGGPETPWAMQVAIDEGGRWRLSLAAVGAALGRTGWSARIAGPAVRAIREPREDAPGPSQVAVVPAPAEPDRVAAEVVSALRTVTPDTSYRLLGGCAVVSADGEVLGWAGGGLGELFRSGLLGGDPFDGDLTPIVVAVPDATIPVTGDG